MNNLDRYIIMALFGAYVGKLLLLGANYSDVGVVLVLAAAHFLVASKSHEKQIDVLKKQLDEARAEMKEDLKAIKTMTDEHRTALTSIKMSQNIKGIK